MMEKIWNDILKMTLTGQISSQKALPILSNVGINTEGLSSEKIILKAITVFNTLQKSSQILPAHPNLIADKPLEEDLATISDTRKKQLFFAIKNNYHSILIEILNKIKENKQVITFDMLPELLEYSKKNAALQKALQPCLGNRGVWLTTINEEWQHITPIDINDTAIFLYSNDNQRIQYIEEYRIQKPLEALELIQDTWNNEPFEIKEKLLKTLSANLSIQDAIFLESCLNEKRKGVRDIAAKLLAKIEHAPLTHRMRDLLSELIQYNSKKNRFEVTLPSTCTKSMQKDGINPRLKVIKDQGPKANQLAQIIAKTPLDWWEKISHKNPQELLLIISKTDWFSIFIWGWATAAHHCNNKTWILAINQFRKDTLFKLQWDNIPLDFLNENLSMALFNQIALQHIQETKENFWDSNPILNNLLLTEGYQWFEPLSMVVIKKIQIAIATGSYAFEWNIKAILKKAAFTVSPQLYPKLLKGWQQETGWNNWQKDIDSFLAIVKFRASIYTSE